MNHGSSVAVEDRDEREQLFAALYTIWSDLKKVSPAQGTPPQLFGSQL